MCKDDLEKLANELVERVDNYVDDILNGEISDMLEANLKCKKE